ncbi:amyloid beta A4 precursor protein-binding family B member 1-interacting protein-like [Eucyclogobius newberryi]|uniref:amyloid beta A4 precursor protein-binding family B member 1-interacting protein-like n=1 Tax=Eucyclogobius newberryi TaxID=166745 RepID=UPI003B5CC0E9
MDDIDTMFSHLLEEIEGMSQSLAQSEGAVTDPDTNSPGPSDIKESLKNLENFEETDSGDIRIAPCEAPPPSSETSVTSVTSETSVTSASPATLHTNTFDSVEARNGPPASKPTMLQTMIVKVWMADGSSKTLMLDRAQTVRDVLDKLFEKTYCDGAVEWSLCEINQEIHIERIFEDHEFLVDSLSSWTDGTDNTLYFMKRQQKYVMFTQPQFFYMWKRSCLKAVSKQEQQLLLKENFEGSTAVVPDLEGWLSLKDDGRKVWKPRYFVLRASGLYYVPKGKTKSSSDLACFVRFEQVNVYTTDEYKLRYRAPTDHCFVLKHPCIQKASHYVKFLCCEDEDSMLLWVNSIRIAKYGTVLYENYKAAVQRAENPPQQSTTSAVKANSQTVPSAPDLDQTEEDEAPPDFTPPPPPGYMAIL